MLVRDRLDVLFEDEEFSELYPSDGRPGFSPGQLALVSVLQFAENLSDRAAADAVRTRIDFKYVLSLELEDPGFDYSVLSEFRARLAEGDAADRLLRVMLQRLVEAGLLKPGGRQRTDATHVLVAVRTLSRLELAGETVRAALEELAGADGEWLLPLIEPEWDKRYGRKVEIGKVPGGEAGVTAVAEAFGQDGQKILAAAWAPDAPARLRVLPQVEILRQVWVHHYYWDVRGRLRWRDGHALPPASLRFDSPYDTDAHYCVKRDTAWSGYRVHLTETCDVERPEVVVHVATTIAPVQDGELTEQIHDDLADARLAPTEHVVDAAYVTPARIERARRVHGITLLGPVVPDHSHQAKSGDGFDKSAFTIDWDRQQATCPLPPRSRQPGVAALAHQRPQLHPSQVRQGHLPGLPSPYPVHHLHHPPPRTRPAAHPRTPRDPDPQPPGPAHPGLAAALRDPRRHRGHPLPERPYLRPAQNPLPRPAKDPRPARSDRARMQPYPRRRLDRRPNTHPKPINTLPRPLHRHRIGTQDHQQSPGIEANRTSSSEQTLTPEKSPDETFSHTPR